MNNEYDNEKFFNQYAMMPRSKEGLSAAGGLAPCGIPFGK